MESILKSDIFFFITSISVIILTFICAIVLFFGIKIIRHMLYVVKKIREESDNVSNDIQELRNKIKDNGLKIGGTIGSVFSFFVSSFGSGLFNGLKNTYKSKYSDKKTQSSKKRKNESDADESI